MKLRLSESIINFYVKSVVVSFHVLQVSHDTLNPSKDYHFTFLFVLYTCLSVLIATLLTG